MMKFMPNPEKLQMTEIPRHLLEYAREISLWMDRNGHVKWEMGKICSRNFADQVKVYEDYFKFRKECPDNKIFLVVVVLVSTSLTRIVMAKDKNEAHDKTKKYLEEVWFGHKEEKYTINVRDTIF